MLVAEEQFSGEFHYDKANNEIHISLSNPDKVNAFVKTALYEEMVSWFLNAIGGTRDFTISGGSANASFTLNPDDKDTKSHKWEIVNNLKSLGLQEK